MEKEKKKSAFPLSFSFGQRRSCQVEGGASPELSGTGAALTVLDFSRMNSLLPDCNLFRYIMLFRV